jgi:hypothetical protein
MFFSFIVMVAVAVLAQPEIFSRFALDSVQNGSLLTSNEGPLNATAVGFSFDRGVAKSGNDRALISLDWSGHGFVHGAYISVWLRFAVRNASLDATSLLTSETVNITVSFDAIDNVASFAANFVKNGASTVTRVGPVRGFGATWRRLTVGYSGGVYYMRVYTFDLNGMVDVDEMPLTTSSTTSVPPSSSLVLGGTFFPQQVEFKDLVLFRPRNVSDPMTAAFDERVARQYDPTVIGGSVATGPTATRTPTTAATTPTATTTATKAKPTGTLTNTASILGPNSMSPSTPTDVAVTMTDDDSLLIGGAVGGGVLAMIVTLLLAVAWHRRQRHNQPSHPADYGVVASAVAEYTDVADVRSQGRSEYEAASSKLEM